MCNVNDDFGSLTILVVKNIITKQQSNQNKKKRLTNK